MSHFDAIIIGTGQAGPSLAARFVAAGQSVAITSRAIVVNDEILEADKISINPLSASAGADVYDSERMKVRFQVDGQNLTNVVDVIDFGVFFQGMRLALHAVLPCVSQRTFILTFVEKSQIGGRDFLR